MHLPNESDGLRIPIFVSALHTGIVVTTETTVVLDRVQLRDVTLEDEDLMRDLLATLIADTERQMPLLDLAIRDTDGPRCARLAHYCKGACSNVGAVAAASALAQLEQSAKDGAMEECARQLAALAKEVDRLRAEEI